MWPNQQQHIFSMGKCDPIQLQSVNDGKTEEIVLRNKYQLAKIGNLILTVWNCNIHPSSTVKNLDVCVITLLIVIPG